MTLSRLRRNCILLILSGFFFVSLGFLWSEYHYQIRNTLSYATRPLWDRPDGPKKIITHYYVNGMTLDRHACSLHGWNERAKGDSVVLLDAVLVSSELDLLEIRLHELNRSVDRFFIVESNATFTGLPKPTYFADNRGRFAEFEGKLEYHFLPGYPLGHGQSPWDVEAATRDSMTDHLRAYVQTLTSGVETLVIMSDVDEIPSWHTLALLKACDFGNSIHLLLRNYVYSFEWYLGMSSWRASVHRFILPESPDGEDATYYQHSLSTTTGLSDSGWHCSYCFRTLSEYAAKMKGFSHSDRIGGNQNLLDESRIQDVICRGDDIFGMLPEAYNYGELLSLMHLQPSYSAVHLPSYILENAERFKFLLPGGCMRNAHSD